MTYVLGYQQESNQKADMGTIVHKTLEVLAALKKYAQDNPNAEILTVDDDAIGKFSCDRATILEPYTLTTAEVDKTNKTRINKQIYKSPCLINYGHTRYGVETVHRIFDLTYAFYRVRFGHHNWTSLAERDMLNWTWMALEYLDGVCDPRKRTIVEPERRFDFTIDADWAHYKYGNIEGQLSLKGTIDLITQVDDDTYEIIDWKGLPLETPIPTVGGWTTMGDIQVGDTVFDENGNQTKVVGKSKVKYRDCYKITFDDKSTATSDDEHLWKLADDSVVSTPNLKVGDKISLTKPLTIKDIELPIDPYVLGIWLGDGRCRSGEVCSSDSFVFEEIKRRGCSVGENIGGKNRCVSRTIIGLTTKLRKSGLLNNKHIPKTYLRASTKQRLELLRGLMDSDGSVNKIRKQAVFTSCNNKLSDDVMELLLSLGQRPSQANVYNHQFGSPIAVYPISFRPIDINPFLLPRKADNIDQHWGSGRSNVRKITSIENVGSKETQCIAVDSDSHTFLCTKHMIPTHNTGQRLDWSTGEVKTLEKLQKDPQLMLYYYAAKRLYPDKEIILTINFIRDGGPFSICFDEETIPKMEGLLKKQFLAVQKCRLPKLLDDKQRDFRCQKLCHYYKNNWPGTNQNMCRFIRNETLTKGIDKVVQLHKHKDHAFDKYNAPGGI